MSIKPCYAYRDWAKHYEKSDTRKSTKRGNPLMWVAWPTRQDGKGFRRLARHPDGIPAMAGHALLVQVAAKMPVHGVLADEDGPLNAQDLSDQTGFPVTLFETALKVLSEPQIGWIWEVEWPVLSGQQPDSGGGVSAYVRTVRTTPLIPHGGNSQDAAPEDGMPAGRESPDENPTQDDPTPEVSPYTPAELGAAWEAFSKWSQVATRFPLALGHNHEDRIRKLFAAIATEPPVVHGGKPVPQRLLIPLAVENLIASGTGFKSITYAAKCVQSKLNEWAKEGPPANGSPRKTDPLAAGKSMRKAQQSIDPLAAVKAHEKLIGVSSNDHDRKSKNKPTAPTAGSPERDGGDRTPGPDSTA